MPDDEVEILLNDYSDLISEDFKVWYTARFKQLGRDMVMRLASEARSDGIDKQRLFSYLVKKKCS